MLGVEGRYRVGDLCDMVLRLGGRESIFLFSHS
jgi:hypothetical protein